MVISSMKTGVLDQDCVPNDRPSRACKKTVPASVSRFSVPHFRVPPSHEEGGGEGLTEHLASVLGSA
jgi:hypothetical protein